MSGKENPYKLHEEMGDIMRENVTIVRYNKKLKETDEKLQEFMERWNNIGISDNTQWSNQDVMFVRQLRNMMELARVITLGALNRNESRGSHYKPEYPERDDENWLKTTKAYWTENGPRFEYEEVDTSLVKPVPRKYDVDGRQEVKEAK